MATSLLIPYRPSTEERERLWEFTHRFWSTFLPELEIVTSDDAGEHDDLFNHGQAYNRARTQANGDVLILGDADTVFLGKVRRIREAISRAEHRGEWSMPNLYRQLSPDGTRRLMAGHTVSDEHFDYTGGTSWSGVVVVPTRAFDAVGGSDERYVAHGADDVALGLKLTTLWGAHERFDGQAVHLFHKRGEQEKDHHRYAGEQRELTERYIAAAGDEEAMRAVMET